MKIKNKKLVFSFLPIALANVLVFAGWFHLFSVIGAQREKIANARLNLALAEKRAVDSKSLKSLMEEIAEKRNRIDAVFLDNERIIEFIETLERLSGQTGVSLDIKSVSVGKGGAVFRLEAAGDFGGVFKYLGLVENLSYQVFIKKSYIQLNENEPTGLDEKDKGKWSANFEIVLSSFIGNEKD